MSDTAGNSGKWGDLGQRVLWGLIMLAVGAVALWAGGVIFAALGTLIVGAMIWELVRMVRPGHDTAALQEAGLAAVGFAAALWVPAISVLILGGLVIVLVGRTGKHMRQVALYSSGIFLAGLGLVWLRLEHGLNAALWVVGVVVISDVMGYFAGRMIGGPKFWPRISPKKTWSGTIAGWIGAAVFSLIMAYTFFDTPLYLLPLVALAGIALAVAAQMGDIAESALKRKMKVKDSSNLIPGHGGVMDRFDAMMGASLLVSLVTGVLAMGL